MGWLHFGLLMLVILSVQANHKFRRGRYRKVSKAAKLPQKQSLPAWIQKKLDTTCEGCDIGGERHFLSHPTSCEKYIEVYDEGGKRVELERDCPSGLFWDHIQLQCNHAYDVSCKTDPCKEEGKKAYGIPLLCSCYFQCIMGCSVLRCCPGGQQYDPETCTCAINDPCPVEEVVAVECDKSEVAGDNRKFTIGASAFEFECQQYTRFFQSRCACDLDVSQIVFQPQEEECSAAVDFLFDGDFLDSSGNDAYAEVQDVTIVDDAANFDGNDLINIMRFANDDFGQNLVIIVKFKQSSSVNRVEALVTNCIKNEQQTSSVSILVDPVNDEVIFKAVTDDGEAELRVHFTANMYNTATLAYNGENLYGFVVDGTNPASMKSTPLTGDIQSRKSGIILGAGSQLNCFTGSMDQFELYKCIPDSVMLFNK